MTLHDIIADIPGLASTVSLIEVMSPLGRRRLMATPWMCDAAEINSHQEGIAQLLDTEGTPALAAIRLALMKVREIRGTYSRLCAGERLDDIELFELKGILLASLELREALSQTRITAVTIPDLTEAADILDPRRARVPHFYIYDDYSEELAEIRRRMKNLDADASPEAAEEARQLFDRVSAIEDDVRENLSARLRLHADAIGEAIDNIARIDVFQALAAFASAEHLCRPEITGGYTEYRALSNIPVRAALAQRGKKFQDIDITLTPGVTIVTGANMAGKSVLLKSLALAQAMTQLGMYVPAAEARVRPVDEVTMSIGDEQSELEGLSSYAAEMLRIDLILRKIRQGRRLLALIDEPARTTNPAEGLALVSAMTSILSSQPGIAVVTTHYSGIPTKCRRLRARGLSDIPQGTPLRARDINKYIDYSLEEDDGRPAPHEALRIAALLGIDAELIDKAQISLYKKTDLT